MKRNVTYEFLREAHTKEKSKQKLNEKHFIISPYVVLLCVQTLFTVFLYYLPQGDCKVLYKQ